MPPYHLRAVVRDAVAPSVPAQVYGSTRGWGGVTNIVNPIQRFGTGADPLEFTEWKPPRILQRVEVEAAFLGSGEARTICGAIPRDAFSVGWTVTDGTRRIDALEDIERRTFLRREAAHAAVMANLYGECFLWPVVREHGAPVPEDRLCEPLDLSAVTGIDRYELILGGIGREATPDQASRSRALAGPYQLGQPTVYMVTVARAGVTFTGRIHTSRMVKFSGDYLSPRTLLAVGQYQQGESISVLQAVVEALFNWKETGIASRRAAQQITEKILHSPYVPAPDAPDEFLTASMARVFALREGSHLRTTLLGMNPDGTAAETLTRLNFPVDGLQHLDDAALTHLAAATGGKLCKEILAGLQPTGVINSGPSWEAGYWRVVNDWREADLRPALEYLIPVEYMATRGEVPDNWRLTFEPLGNVTPTEQADIDQKNAQTASIYVDLGAATPKQVRRSLFGPEATPPAGIQPAIPEDGEPTAAAPMAPGTRLDPVARALAEQAPKPDPTVPPEEGEDVQGAALNGAQILAMDPSGILVGYRSGAITREGCIAQMRLVYPAAPVSLIIATVDGQVVGAVTTDASPSAVWVALELDPAPIAALGAWLPPGSTTATWPHVTLAYIGEVRPSVLGDILAVVAAQVAAAPRAVVPDDVGPLGEGGAQVVFLRSGGLRSLADQLLRGTYHLGKAEQFPRFIPHATIGYGGDLRDGWTLPEAIAVRALVVKRGDEEIARYGVS